MEILEEKNLMEAPVLYSMFNSQTSILNEKTNGTNSTSSVQTSTINEKSTEKSATSNAANNSKFKIQNFLWQLSTREWIPNTKTWQEFFGHQKIAWMKTEKKLQADAKTADGFFEAQTIARAIKFAVNNGADTINLSFGGPTASKAIEEAIAYAEEKGVVVFSAAGNYATNNDEKPMYPANWNQKYSNVVSVGATDETGNMTVFSNFGKKTVDIFAPGKDLITTLPNNQQGKVSGTSFSCPFVVRVWGNTR